MHIYGFITVFLGSTGVCLQALMFKTCYFSHTVDSCSTPSYPLYGTLCVTSCLFKTTLYQKTLIVQLSR